MQLAKSENALSNIIMTRDGFVVATGLLLALHLTGFLFEDTMSGECRPGFVRVDQWCFSFHTEPTSMLQSSDVCHQHGAHMAVLDSQEKEKALTDYIEQMGFFHIHQERKELYKIAKHESDVQAEKNKFCEDYKLHGTHSDKYRHIPNAKVPLHTSEQTSALHQDSTSNIPGAGLGAWTDQFVPQYTILGVYEGIINTREPVFELYSWQVDRQGSNGTYVIDAADPACSNWLRFFNSPTTNREENVISVPCAGIVFYMTSRDVEPGTELLVWYGDDYGRFLGVNRIHPEYDLNGSVALRANVITYIDDKCLVFDDWTPVTYQNWLNNDNDKSETMLDQIFGLLLTYHHDNKWYWVAERNYTYYTGHEGLKLPFICEDSTNNSGVG